MRMVKNIIIFIVALYIGIVIFMPKSQLYYYAEEQLNSKGIVIGNEELVDKIPSLDILHMVVYYQGIDVVRVSKLKITPLLLINKIEADDIELLNIAKKFLNVNITSLKANQSILKPFKVKIDAVGNFGVVSGYADLKNRIIHLDLIKPKDINSIKRYLRKSSKGWYYESKF